MNDWKIRSNRRNFQPGDKVYAALPHGTVAAVVERAVPPSDGIAGMARLRVALHGPERAWVVFGVYGRPVIFSRLSRRIEEIKALDR